MLFTIKSWLYTLLNAFGAKPQAVPIEGILRENGCPFTTSSDKNVKQYYFKYQGGNFVATVMANGSDQCNVLIAFKGVKGMFDYHFARHLKKRNPGKIPEPSRF